MEMKHKTLLAKTGLRTEISARESDASTPNRVAHLFGSTGIHISAIFEREFAWMSEKALPKHKNGHEMGRHGSKWVDIKAELIADEF